MTEFDPVTDFLTREQEALGELGPEINFPNQPDVFANEPTESQENGGFVFLNGEQKQDNAPSPQPFEDAYPQHATGPNYQLSNGLTGLNENTNSVFTANSEANETWRKEFNERVAQKDAAEEKSMAELKESGQKELENWYKHYQNQLKTRAQELRENTDSGTENGDTFGSTTTKPTVGDKEVWERVCDMCDFQVSLRPPPPLMDYNHSRPRFSVQVLDNSHVE
ncbi:unnamed protein product [Echinostoma caproni]|uniref:Clathrin light chain n=1 Tax=Echinostoma caproni TaxID=27848 RepID=A0A183B0Q2_9TREM|nr:unnamed protein product [Echinostoma caproni]